MHKKNKLKAALLFFLGAAMTGNNAYSQQGGNILSGEPKLVSVQFSFTEGPAVDRRGNIYFTDQPNNKIWKYTTKGQLSVFMDTAGRSNGLYFDKQGNIIACADEYDQLWSITPHKEVTVLIKDFQGKRLNGPNDLWIDPEGGIYFTDPYYQRSYWTRTSPDMESQDVYYLPPHAMEPVIVADDLEKPNGIVGTPDGRHLFVADIGAGKTYKYTIAPDGALKNKQLFVSQGSDGMTLDSKGNLYLTGKGVTIYNPSGVKTAYIPIQGARTSNVCFGGRHRKQLFITAGNSIYIQRMKVKGVE